MKVSNSILEQKIADRARDYIFQRGVLGWSMDQLAADTGIAKNTLYKIVSSKEDLVLKVVINYVQATQAQLVALIEHEPDYLTALEKMIVIFPALVGGHATNAFQDVFNEYPSVEESVYSHRDMLTNKVIGFLETGISRGILRSDLQADFIFSMLQALILYFMKSTNHGSELSERLSLAFRCLLEGIRSK
ncbi:MAG: hypothetical protein A2Y65_05910 [Deltaproteobacteria bacterium RBG_13_52_11]|nr:MAG: hypothetical protein A2Y65_05910 [Deltaproteobacteria bacterium RBG_13_52_11]